MKPSNLRGLYAITDSQLISETNFLDTMKSVLIGGASIIQYRDKSSDTNKRLTQAKQLRKLCNEFNARLIINDDIELAQQSEADGVHLGKDDLSISEARQKLGKQVTIGISCYNNIDLAIEAQKLGANYVAFGAVYSSVTKPDATAATFETLQAAKSQLSIPVCAIGGINAQNAQPVIATGIDMIAVISDLYAGNDTQARSEALSDLFR